jgi:hypothetical protein
MIVNYNRNCSFIVLATVITIVSYNRKTFIVQATGFEPMNSGSVVWCTSNCGAAAVQ